MCKLSQVEFLILLVLVVVRRLKSNEARSEWKSDLSQAQDADCGLQRKSRNEVSFVDS